MSCNRTPHHLTYSQHIHKTHIPVYFFPLIVNVTSVSSVSELQQEKQHLSMYYMVFVDSEMYLFVVLWQDCLVYKVIERYMGRYHM